MTDPIRMSIPDCPPPKDFDSTSLTTQLVTVPGVDKPLIGDCKQGVQTIFHPPLPLRPILKPPPNRFRLEILRKYPHLVNWDSLYDKKQRKLRDPNDPMISTYERDYGSSIGQFELHRIGNLESPVQEETGRLPGANYKPNNWSPICSEMERFYTLPGGGWGLKKELRPKEPEPMKPPPGAGAIKIKWESEYQANINGIANYMKKIGALTRKYAMVHRIPTLPD